MEYELEPTQEAEQETAISENDVENVADEEPIDLNATQEPDADADEQPDQDNDGEPAAEDDGADDAQWAEIEVAGKAYKVPAEIKDGFMMQADYTRKTQEAAEMRREVEAKAAQVDQVLNISQEEMSARSYLMSVESRLKEFNQFDWNSLADDPIGRSDKQFELQQLREQHQQASQYINQKGQERTALTEQMTAKRLQETAQFAQKNITGWTPEMDTKITEFAVKTAEGFGMGKDETMEMLKGASNPFVYSLLHRAFIGDQYMQNKSAKPKPVNPAVKPLSKVTAKANPTNATRVEDVDDMETYAAMRKKQMGVGIR